MKWMMSSSDDQYALQNVYRRYLPNHIQVIQFGSHGHSNFRGITRLRKRVFRSIDFWNANRNLISMVQAHRPEVLFVFKGMEYTAATIQQVRQLGVYTVNYNADHPFKHYRQGTGNQRVSEAAFQYDLHITYSGLILEECRRRGLSAIQIPFGHEISESTYGELEKTREIPGVGFVGNPDRNRADLLRMIVAEGIPTYVNGNHWNRWLEPSPNLVIGEPLVGREIQEFMRRYRVQLNPLRPHNQGSHNMRSAEIPAVGGIMLTNESDEHTGMFQPDEAAFYFANNIQMIQKVESILNLSDESAKLVRDAARQASIANHYSRRVEYCVKEIERRSRASDGNLIRKCAKTSE